MLFAKLNKHGRQRIHKTDQAQAHERKEVRPRASTCMILTLNAFSKLNAVQLLPQAGLGGQAVTQARQPRHARGTKKKGGLT